MNDLDPRTLIVLTFLEEYDIDMGNERNGEAPRWATHTDGARELIERLEARNA